MSRWRRWGSGWGGGLSQYWRRKAHTLGALLMEVPIRSRVALHQCKRMARQQMSTMAEQAALSILNRLSCSLTFVIAAGVGVYLVGMWGGGWTLCHGAKLTDWFGSSSMSWSWLVLHPGPIEPNRLGPVALEGHLRPTLRLTYLTYP